MPEGLEIRRAAQPVHDAVTGQPLRIEWRHPTLIARAAQARIDRLESRGKAMLTRLSTPAVVAALLDQGVRRLDERGRGIFFCAACQGVRLAERSPTS